MMQGQLYLEFLLDTGIPPSSVRDAKKRRQKLLFRCFSEYPWVTRNLSFAEGGR